MPRSESETGISPDGLRAGPRAPILSGVGVLITLGLAWLGGIALWPGSDSGQESRTLPQADTQSQADPVVERVDSLAWLQTSLPVAAETDVWLQPALKQLEACFRDPNAGAGRPPVWVSEAFTASGVQAEAMAVKFDQPAMRVQRWVRDSHAPRFRGPQQWRDWIDHLTAWNRCARDFQVYLDVYAIQPSDDRSRIRVRVMAEMAGIANEEFSDVVERGFRKRAQQATSLWELEWHQVAGPSDWQLISAQVLAHEQVTCWTNAPRLMLDCTHSILSPDRGTAADLARGIDDWSGDIPGIDLRGNHGIAIGDANGDGLEDVYLCQPHGLPNRLLLQQADGTIRDASQGSRTDVLDDSTAALLLDFDNDGDPDLMVSTVDQLVIWSNEDGRFRIEAHIPHGGLAESLVAADYDRDGDLDIFICRSEGHETSGRLFSFPDLSSSVYRGGRNVLLRNEGSFQFSDATAEVGLVSSENQRCSRAAAWFDFDLDGDPDLYIANDFGPDQLFENREGGFVNVSREQGIDDHGRQQTVSVGDFNRDGREDLAVATDVPLGGLKFRQDNATAGLYRESRIRYGLASGSFADYSLRAPIFNAQSVYGSAVTDLNRDGREDLLFSNGGYTRRGQDLTSLGYAHGFDNSKPPEFESQRDRGEPFTGEALARHLEVMCRRGCSWSKHQRNRCFVNIGEAGFANISSISGFGLPDDARAIATVDWDQDGDEDVITTCRTAPQLRIFCNQLNRPDESITFRLTGTESNRDAIGARVELTWPTGERFVKSVRAGSGRKSQSSRRLIFGTPDPRSAVRATVHWPSGRQQELGELEPGSLIRVVEGEPHQADRRTPRLTRIRPGQLDPVAVSATGGSRLAARFQPRQPMIRLQAQTSPGRWQSIAGDDSQYRLLMFWGRDTESNRWLREIRAAGTDWWQDVKPLALLIDEPEVTPEHQWKYGSQSLTMLEYEGAWGALAGSSRDQLSILFGHWFNDRRLPELPWAVLIDDRHRACVFYQRDTFSLDQIRADAKRLTSGEPAEGRELELGRGRWLSPRPETMALPIHRELEAAGYGAAATDLLSRAAPDRARRLTRQAVALHAQLHLPLAVTMLEQAIRLAPDDADAWLRLGGIEHDQSRSLPFGSDAALAKWTAAVQHLKEACRLRPSHWQSRYQLVQAYLSSNHTALARATLEDFLSRDPTCAHAQAAYGRLLLQLGDREAARVQLASAHRQRPQLSGLHQDLGRLAMLEQQYDQAREWWEMAQRQQPDDPAIGRSLAELDFLTGNLAGARTRWQAWQDRAGKTDHRSDSLIAWILDTESKSWKSDRARQQRLIPSLRQVEGLPPETLQDYASCFAERQWFDEAMRFQRLAVDRWPETALTGAVAARQRLAHYRDLAEARMAEHAPANGTDSR